MADRQAAERRGRRAEQMAAVYLRLSGYAILASRWRTPVGEVDLVVRKNRTLAFVEIKQRRHGVTPDLVTQRQKKRIVQAAGAFVSRHPQFAEYDIRFDLILMGGARPHHIKAAWDENA